MRTPQAFAATGVGARGVSMNSNESSDGESDAAFDMFAVSENSE